VAGMAVIRADSREDAIEQVKAFLKVAGDGETELRQLYEMPESGAESDADLTKTFAHQHA
jgi:hypothetical protein